MSRPSEVYVHPFLPEEQESIHRLYQQTTHVGLKSRCHIISLSAQQYSVPQIAALLVSSEDPVARCIHAFNRSGLDQILPQERVGRPAKITEEYLKKLLELVERGPRDLHYPFSTWTTALLAVALKEHTGLEVDESGVRRTSHRQGYGVQLSVLWVSSPNPDYEQNCARLHELRRRALAGEIDLYYEDEVELALLPGVMRCWSKQGQQRAIEHKDNALFRLLLTQLAPPDASPTDRKKYVVVDNYRIHFAKPVQALLAEHQGEIELVYSSIRLNGSGSTCVAKSRLTFVALFR